MIPWFARSVDMMETREFRRIPRTQRLLCYGAWVRLGDLIGRYCEWDALVGPRGDPWSIGEIADQLCMEPEAAELAIQALADAELIDKGAWVNRKMVKIPVLIVIAAEWFRRSNSERVFRHLQEHGLTDLGGPRRLTRGTRSDTESAPSLFGEPPGGTVSLGATPVRKEDKRVEKKPPTTRGRSKYGPRVESAVPPPRQRIGLDAQTGKFIGILPEDLARWREAYPAVNVDAVLPHIALVALDQVPPVTDVSAFIRNCLQNEARWGRDRQAGGPGAAIKRDGDWASAEAGRVQV